MNPVQEFRATFDDPENYLSLTKNCQTLYLQMFFPTKKMRRQAILNFFFTAKRMGFSTKCSCKTIALVFHVSPRTVCRIIKLS